MAAKKKFSKILDLELEVAFSRKTQPLWFRVLKYLILGVIIYLFWGRPLLWIILGVLSVLALGTHFWYRNKTDGWRKSYGLWKHDKEEN